MFLLKNTLDLDSKNGLSIAHSWKDIMYISSPMHPWFPKFVQCEIGQTFEQLQNGLEAQNVTNKLWTHNFKSTF